MDNLKKILIIEDDHTLGEILLNKLSSEGYTAYWEQNGNTGLKKMREAMPDLVLLDIVMPEKDGYEVLEEVGKDKALKNIPIIIISNSGEPLELKRILELGAKDYIVKADFSPNEVLDKVRKYINRDGISLDEDEKKKAAGIKILIVEDDPFLVSLATGRLEKEGYKISFVSDGTQALKSLEVEIPALMLLDVVMPGISGFEVLKEIKANPNYNKMAVIIFSNLSQEHEIEEGMKLGADAFLIKANFTLKELIDKINDLLKEKGRI